MKQTSVIRALWSLVAACLAGISCAAEPTTVLRRSLVIMPVAGGEARELMHDPGQWCGSPRWSPDGEWVAYDTPGRREGQIWIVRSDGSEKRAVGFGGMPTWSPDGADLAWHTYDGRGVVVARVDGLAEEKIVDHWGNPVWLRDGSRILTISHQEGGLAAYNPQTGKEAETIPAPGIQHGYSVSPDGQWVSYRNRRGQLMMASFDPAVAPRVRIATGKTGCSSWSPDGERLVVSWTPPGAPRPRLYTLSPHGEEAPRLVPGQHEQDAYFQPDWSPDGGSIVLTREHRGAIQPEVEGEGFPPEP